MLSNEFINVACFVLTTWVVLRVAYRFMDRYSQQQLDKEDYSLDHECHCEECICDKESNCSNPIISVENWNDLMLDEDEEEI